MPCKHGKRKTRRRKGGHAPVEDEAAAIGRQWRVENERHERERRRERDRQEERAHWFAAAAEAGEAIHDRWTVITMFAPDEVTSILAVLRPLRTQAARLGPQSDHLREIYAALSPSPRETPAPTMAQTVSLSAALQEAAAGARGTVTSDATGKRVSLSSWLHSAARRVWQTVAARARDLADGTKLVLALPAVRDAIANAPHRCPLLNADGQLDNSAFTPSAPVKTTDLLDCLLETLDAAEEEALRNA
jgi:hypothetical protein